MTNNFSPNSGGYDHGRKYQVGFLEVAGNAFDKDITNRNIDSKKLYKEDLVKKLQAIAMLVHGRVFSFLSMHCINNKFVVKNYDDFILPTTKEVEIRAPKRVGSGHDLIDPGLTRVNIML
ncbi:11967_t:CDS:2 [Entrophospora sp. SA101]|nr:11967_t:CDS:2 [Entrophospora sp. SA101]